MKALPTDSVYRGNAQRVVKFEFNRQANTALRPGVQFTLTAFLTDNHINTDRAVKAIVH